jgi:hypothetical protein
MPSTILLNTPVAEIIYLQTTMSIITKQDLLFLKEMSSRVYKDNSMASNSSKDEREKLMALRRSLKIIADEYKRKYDDVYGLFESNVSSGNPITIGKSHLNRVWAGISKGAENKQYSAQISFVLNPEKLGLDVGFYFGRASAHMLNRETKSKFESQLRKLGIILSTEINDDQKLNTLFNSLFDYGFHASVYKTVMPPDIWLDSIQQDPQSSQIVYTIHPDESGNIEPSTIDLYVSMIIYLMNPIPGFIEGNEIEKKRKYKPLTPQQRAKQAERRTLIGAEGEEYVMRYEKERLADLGISKKYPIQKSLESTDYGYDILSCDHNGSEIYIEVKTTTRLRDDLHSEMFYISSGEYKFYLENKNEFKLYRVYDIEGTPDLDIKDLSVAEIIPDSYLVIPR